VKSRLTCWCWVRSGGGPTARTGRPSACGAGLVAGADLLTDKQTQRLHDLFQTDEHVEVQATWGIYQRMITAYREPDRPRGRELISNLIELLSHGVPAALTEADIVTYARERGVDVRVVWPSGSQRS